MTDNIRRDRYSTAEARNPTWPHAIGAIALGVLGACATTSATGNAPSSNANGGASEGDRAAATVRANDLVRHVRTLASDDFEGRFPGSAGEAKTVAYLAAELSRMGIAPAPGGYLQSVPLRSTTPQPGAALSVRRNGRTVELTWGEDFLAGTPHSEPLALDDIDAVFVGYGIEAPEQNWNDYAGVDLRGKLAIALGGDPGMVADDSDLFEGRAMTYHATSAAKKAAAARHGAAGLLILRADGEGGIPWQTLAAGARGPRMGLDDRSGASLSFSGLLRRDRAAALFSALDLDRATAAASVRGFRPRDLGARVTMRLASSHEPTTSHNVIGWIRGATRPNEYVVYTAHWDHVGRRAGMSGDNIFNGAVDNATGTAALLEVAEAFAAMKTPPARSVVFVATTAEEQGLLGSRYYVENPVFPLAQTVGVINMDALFPFGETRGMTVVAMGDNELDQFLAPAARSVGRTLYPDPSPEAGAFFRSDHYPFAEKGVPTLFAVGGPAPVPEEKVRMEDFVEYVTQRYHQPADEFDPASWDMAGIVQDTITYFRTGLALANSDAFPNWKPGHPFRHLRDQMRATASQRPAVAPTGRSRTALD